MYGNTPSGGFCAIRIYIYIRTRVFSCYSVIYFLFLSAYYGDYQVLT